MVPRGTNRPASDPAASGEWEPSVPADEGHRKDGVLPGEETIGALRMLHQALLRKKKELTGTLESRELEIEAGLRPAAGETGPHGAGGGDRTSERLRNEFYQIYLKDLGDLVEEATGNVMSVLRSLPGPSFEMSMLLHEFEETIRELDRTRRKCAVDVKRRLDEKRFAGLESRLRQATAELGNAHEHIREMELELDDLTRTLGMNRAELKRRITSGEEWKENYARDLRKELIREVRETLEHEIRDDMEKRIRIELENELRIETQNGNRIKQVRAQSGHMTGNTGTPGQGRPEPVPFVRCPVCTERIEILSPGRPMNVQCPGCGSGYTIREKQRDDPIPPTHGAGGPTEHRDRGIHPHPFSGPTEGYHAPDHPSVHGNVKSAEHGSSREPWENIEDLLPPDSGDNEREFRRLAAEPPPSNPGGTHRIECPYCGRAHTVPEGLTQRLTCACGRRIKTG